jgi:hypothetical protein
MRDVHTAGRENSPRGEVSGVWIVVSAIVAAMLVATFAVVFLSRGDSAEPIPRASTSPPPRYDRVQAQQILDDIVASALETADTSGYAGSAIDVDTLSATIRWTSPVPGDVQALAGTDPATGARLSVVIVSYSQDQVNAAGRRIFAATASEGLVSPNVTGATSDGAALRIEVRPVDLARARAEREAFAHLAEMPVQIVAGADAPPRG